MKKKRDFEARRAYHEAGHAVVALFLHVPFRYVTVVPNDDSLGRLSYRKLSKTMSDDYSRRPLQQRDFWERRTIVSFAGRIAEQKYTGRRIRYGHSADYRNITEACLKFVGEDPESQYHWSSWLHSIAKGHINSRWKEVGLVARELVKRRTLSYREVREICMPGSQALEDSLKAKKKGK